MNIGYASLGDMQSWAFATMKRQPDFVIGDPLNPYLRRFGSYREVTPEGSFIRQPGDVVTREATALHRLELIDGEPCISLFFTGPKVRDWGFQCPKGWVPWQDFTGGANGELVGRGCGEFA